MTDSDLVIMCLLSSYSNQSGNVCRVDLLLCLLAAIDKHHWKSKDFYPYVNVASGIAKMFVGELIETGKFIILAL